MRRVRWLSAKWPVSMRTIASRMKNRLFVAGSVDGFVVDRVRDDFIEAHYIEKISFQEVITDPFGEQSLFERVGYRQINFTLHSGFPNIELSDPHRNTRAFTSRILELCDFAVSIEPLSLNLLDWVSQIETRLETSVLIDSLQISGVELEPGVQSKMLIHGLSDVRPAMDKITQDRNFELEKLQMKVKVDSRLIPVQISNIGAAKIPEEFWRDFRPALRDALSMFEK